MPVPTSKESAVRTKPNPVESTDVATDPDSSDAPELTPAGQTTSPYFFGIDVGGTGIKIGLVDRQGRTVAYDKMPTRQADGPAVACSRIGELCREIAGVIGGLSEVTATGLGCPGPLNLQDGTVVAAPQLKSWWGFNLRDAVSKSLGMPVTLLNDANAAAYGEFWLGSGRGSDSLVMLTLGTGVGGGIIVDGTLVNGKNSCGSECGHLIVDSSLDAPLCPCGGRGHLEAYASASAVVRRTRERLAAGEPSSLSDDASLTALSVYHAATAQDPLALSILDETARWLGIGVSSLVHTIDPGAVVLGGAMDFGGIGDLVGERFLAGVRNEFHARAFEAVHAGTSIRFARLGGHAGYLGAAGYAIRDAA